MSATLIVRKNIGLLSWKGLALVTLGVMLAVFYFGRFVGTTPEIDRRLKEGADTLVQRAVDRLPAAQVTGRLLVLPFQGDHTRYLRDRFMDVAAGSGKYPVANLGWFGDKLRQAGFDLSTPATLADAITAAANLPADHFLWGEVESWRLPDPDHPERPVLRLTVHLIDGHLKQAVWRDTLQYPDADPAQAGADLRRMGGLDLAGLVWRLLGWALGTLLLPLLLWPVTQAVLSQKSNLGNGVLLAGYTAVSVGASWLLGQGLLDGLALPLTVGACGVVALWFYYWGLSLLDELV